MSLQLKVEIERLKTFDALHIKMFLEKRTLIKVKKMVRSISIHIKIKQLNELEDGSWVGNSFCRILLLLYTCFPVGNLFLSGRCSCWYNYIFGCSGLLVYIIFLVICTNFWFDVGHTWIADFKSVSVEYISIFTGWWKMFIY